MKELVLITPSYVNIESSDGLINLEDLTNFNFIMRKEGSGTQNLIESKLKEHKYSINQLNTIAYISSNEAIKEMVRLGLGVSFVSYTSVIDYITLNKVKFFRLKDISFHRKFYFIYSKKKTFTPLENQFLNGVCEYFNINTKR